MSGKSFFVPRRRSGSHDQFVMSEQFIKAGRNIDVVNKAAGCHQNIERLVDYSLQLGVDKVFMEPSQSPDAKRCPVFT